MTGPPPHPRAPGEAAPARCETCGDLAAKMVVLSADAAAGLAVCLDGERGRRTVETALLEDVRPGQTLLVHAGTALARDAA